MKGTAVLMNEDHTVTALENVDKTVYDALSTGDNLDHPHYYSGEKEVGFEPVHRVVWSDDIDWDYGY